MENKHHFGAFTKRYSVSKTLRFELKPIGRTLEHIQAKGLIAKDEDLAKSYKLMKSTIDEFHKWFIELALKDVQLTHLEEYAELYLASREKKQDEEYKKQVKAIQTALRKEIASAFNKGEAKSIFSKIDSKDLITQLLVNWIRENKPDAYYDPAFANFTTYFRGFHENRKNMYSSKEQSTAIAYRLIHENLPRFLDNLKIFRQIQSIPELYSNIHVVFEELRDILSVHNIDEVFTLEYYNKVLVQKQIDIYNAIIGGKVDKITQKKIKGLNEYINEYNQKQKSKSDRVPKLKVLYKQILSDTDQLSFTLDQFENSKELLEAVNSFYHYNIKSYQPTDKELTENILIELERLLIELGEYDVDRIYLKNDLQLTAIAQKIFGHYAVFKDALEHYYANVINPNYEQELAAAKSEKKRSALEKQKAIYTKSDFISIGELQKALDSYIKTLDQSLDIVKRYTPTCVQDYFKVHAIAEVKGDSDKVMSLRADIEAKYLCVKGILEQYDEDAELYQDKKNVHNLKLFLDSLLALVHFVKPLIVPDEAGLDKDERFYSQLDPWYDSLSKLITLYNKVRNYVTRKPFSTEKFKLNFENSTLLDGWDVNKESDNFGVLFVKDGLYYLGIMDKKHNKVFQKIPEAKSSSRYSKVNYKLLPGASKMLPKVIFSKKNISYFNPSDEILRIRNHATHTKNGAPQDGFEKQPFNLQDCRTLIDFYKECLEKHPEWKNFGFRFSETASYESIDQFYREVENQGYTISFTDVDEEYINSLIDDGKLYFFQIYNRDFSAHSKGLPNLHTLYWKAVFDPKNLKDPIYKLNGQAEIFYRKASIKKENLVVHPANEPIANKNPLKKGTTSTFSYDLIKDKRYSVDKFQFHVPITLNFKSKNETSLNQEVIKYCQSNPDIKIIGLDRGERHLIYLTLIDEQGRVLYQNSLNKIVSSKYDIVTDYYNLLVNREEERDRSRKDWGEIQSIKELKEGYLSMVVHEIAKLMIAHNAIIVMEDLNKGFKRGRFKVERQIYQKLEKMLIEKLNYLVFKEKDINEPGGIYNALQLTNRFESFKKLGKQSGFLFYVPPTLTSKTDPTTGFVNLFSIKYESIEKSKDFFSRFKSIRYNTEKGYFEFTFDYTDFKVYAEGARTQWTVCTYGDRILTFRNPGQNNKYDNKTINLSLEMEDLLGRYNITYGSGADIKEDICNQNDKNFFLKLTELFKLTVQMRNSIINSEEDYIISPVLNAQGYFFDSRQAGDKLPRNADANGAYHIAKKGLMWLKQIRNHPNDSKKPVDLDTSTNAWLHFAQTMTYCPTKE